MKEVSHQQDVPKFFLAYVYADWVKKNKRSRCSKVHAGNMIRL